MSPRAWLRERLPFAGEDQDSPPSGVSTPTGSGADDPPASGASPAGSVNVPPSVPEDPGVPTTTDDVLRPYDEDLDAELSEGPDSSEDFGPGEAAPATSTAKSAWRRRREWRQEERARRYLARKSVRFPILTRAILLWMLLFALVGVAFGASGAFWWAHFNTQVAELRDETRDLEARSTEALSEIEAQRNSAITEISGALEPLQGFLSEARMIQFAEFFAPAVWFVSTFDEQGQPSVGTAFAVVANDTESLLVTSFTTVQAAALEPSPVITLRNGGVELEARLVNTDPARDLALLSVDRGELVVLDWSPEEEQARALGSRIFPVSGFGGAGATLTSGVLIEQNAAGFLHTAPVGTIARGGPIVTPTGRVLGIASLDYRPLGFDPGGAIHFAAPINEVCTVLLDCGGGIRREPGEAAPDADIDVPIEPD